MSFQIEEVRFNGKDLQLSSINKNKKNKFSIIIGKNGTGKSRLLFKIVKSFLVIFKTHHRQPSFFISKQLSFRKGSDFYEIQYFGNYGSPVMLNKNSNSIADKSNLPSKIIALSTSPFDKFEPVSFLDLDAKVSNNDFYHYVGLKIGPNNFSRNNLVYKFARSIMIHCLNNDTTTNKTTKVFHFLEYKSSITIKFKSIMSQTNIHNLARTNTKSALLNFLESHHYRIFEFLKANKKKNLTEKVLIALKAYASAQSSMTWGLNINLSKSQSNDNDLFKSIILLLDLGLVKVHKITLFKILANKKTKKIELGNASSGEQCVLLTILNLASIIQDNSLICIDEPEISLHPEWQEKYIELLIKTFANYSGCHFIIATHSPQIISKLSSKNCFILGLDDYKLHSSDKYTNRSADFQLANLFKAPGSKNEYLNRESVTLLTKLSKNGKLSIKELKRANELIKKAKFMDDTDTVKELILILKDALEKIANDN